MAFVGSSAPPVGGDAWVGQDFGCLSSKVTLAYEDDGRPAISRAALPADPSHPERLNASHSILEFVSYAALRNGQLVPGRWALDRDDAFALKSLLLHRCCFSRTNTLHAMPSGAQVLAAYDSGLITSQMIDDALIEHFKLLKQVADSKAEALDVVIKGLNLTHPSFLSEREERHAFRRFQEHYERLMRCVWGDDVVIQFSNEAQVLVAYLCRRFKDALGALNRKQLMRQFRGLRKADKEGLTIVVVDSGGSTLNITCTTVYLNGDGSFKHSQSTTSASWAPGSRGGSQMVNDNIRRLIQEKLPNIDPDDLTVIMRRWEEAKFTLDWVENDEDLVLTGPVPTDSNTVTLSPFEIREAFEEAFKAGIAVFKQQVRRFQSLGEAFALFFCGGSFCNPGLRRVMDDFMDEIEAKAQQTGVPFAFAFLRDFDHSWSSAVSAGAGLTMMEIPEPVQVLRGSSIGIQRLFKKTEWTGSSEVDALIGLGYGRCCLDISTATHQRSRTRFSLICDPRYDELVAEGESAGERPISVDSLHISGAAAPYDLGWDVEGTDLPPGRSRFTLEGQDVSLITANDVEALASRPIRLRISCCSIDADGIVQPSADDRCWRLTVITDPASHFLVVDRCEELPVWCQFCSERLVSRAWSCLDCSDFTACDSCYELEVVPSKHHDEHTFALEHVEDRADESD